MEIQQNLPMILILLPLAVSPALAFLRPKASRAVMLAVSLISCAVSLALTVYMCAEDSLPYTIKMGEYGAPFGNELYISRTECIVSLLFSCVHMLSLLGGLHRLDEEIHENRRSLFYTVTSLLLSAIQALCFTNDLFTGYVFLEITTIAAGALIFIRSREGALFASMRYMIMNLLGSGLFLLGLAVMYCLTGELLFPQLKEGVSQILREGRYIRPLTASILLITVGLSIKSALYPFHTWLPNAYSGATPAASSMLSSLVSKAYIFLLIKIVMRVTGPEAFVSLRAGDVVFVYSCIAIILGSIDAIREHNVRRMVSYSSVAQIGYIFLGVSIGTAAGMTAAIFHILAHSISKAMLFPAVDRLTQVSGGNENYRDLRGSGFRAPLAGIAFVVGAFSITGIPIFAGFSSKVYLASAAVESGGWRMLIVLFVLAASTVLNVSYFLRTVITLYRPGERYPLTRDKAVMVPLALALIVFIGLNTALGIFSLPVFEMINDGIMLW
ncbi:MAG: sodium:proton antiporter [Clostridia bacterium]|nr:sodium:proton antiporter [Clostridia bacterium]